MPETLEDILPPPPHKLVKEAADGVKTTLDDVKGGIKDAVDDVKAVVVEAAPHNFIKAARPQDILPSPSELKPPMPPKPPKPPRIND